LLLRVTVLWSLISKNVVHVVVSVEAAQYRDDKAGYDAYVIRQYMEPQLVLDDAIDKICL